MALTIEQVGSAAVFAETVEPFLAADPLLNTQAVGWLDAVLGRERLIAEAANARLFGSPAAAHASPDWPPIMQVVRCDDEVVAAAMQGSGPGLTIVTVPGVSDQTCRAAMNLIGSELATVGPKIITLSGPNASVESINDGLSGAGGQIFGAIRPASLLELVHPLPRVAVTGGSRAPDPSSPADMELLARWQFDFAQETGLAAAQSMNRSAYLFWCNESGPVAMARVGTGENGEVLMRSARIYDVYTPPAHRGHRYGQAATHAVCQLATGRGALHIVLFADVNSASDDPAPLRIYQELGFEPLADFSFASRG